MHKNDVIENLWGLSSTKAARHRHYATTARTAIQATLDEIGNLFKSLEDIEAETDIVINSSVVGIETPLGMMFIALQDGRESN